MMVIFIIKSELVIVLICSLNRLYFIFVLNGHARLHTLGILVSLSCNSRKLACAQINWSVKTKNVGLAKPECS